MSMLATDPSKDPGRYDLTQRDDQKAFAAELMAADRRSRLIQRLKIGLVWLVLFAIIGWLLRLLNIDFAYAVANSGFVLEGIYLTLGVSLASITIATILALIGALGCLSPHAWAQGISGFYVSVIRGTPLLIQIFLIYLGLPQIGVEHHSRNPALGRLFILDAIPAGILALSLNYGAYMTEIFRAGLQSISYGQREAALAIGMTPWQVMRTNHPAAGHPHHHPRCGEPIHRHAEGLGARFDHGRLGNHLPREPLCAKGQHVHGDVPGRRRDVLGR